MFNKENGLKLKKFQDHLSWGNEYKAKSFIGKSAISEICQFLYELIHHCILIMRGK